MIDSGRQTPPPPRYPDEDIAIVGMSCLFPGADNLTQFWHNIVHKVDCIIDATPDWQPELFWDPAGPAVDKTYVRRGGFLGDICRFNPAKYGVMPAAVEGAEPDHFIALRCAYEAVEDAGAPEIPFNREKTGVIVGRGIFVNRGWVTVFQKLFAVDQVLSVLRMIEPHRSEADLEFLRAELKKRLPPANADTFPGLVHSALVGRIANRMDLHGPAYTLDAACASVGLCLEHGVRELRSGRCDAVLVGGSQVSLPAPVHIMFCHLVGALNREGLVAPFSAQAQGTVLGQGCGMVMIKRRSDAERDGNRIYALVKGVGSSSDGRGAGILAPRTEGQQLAIQRAYSQSGLSPSSIECIEAHGTGIALGDATEIETLNACFGGPEPAGPTVGIGSIKSMIGHLIPASGAASLIKAALAVYHRVLPPSLHAEEAHPDLHLDTSRFYVCTEPRPWLHGEAASPRRAGINAFGFGGINTHVILEEHPADETALPRMERTWPAELVVVSAADRDALRARIEALADWVARAQGASLLDVAAAAAADSGASRLAIIAADKEDLARKLSHAGRLLGEPDRDRIQDRGGIYWYAEPLARRGRVAFVFPGEGSQYLNMHADLCRNFPEVRRQFDLTDLALRRRGSGASLGAILYPQPSQAEHAEQGLFRMEIAVAAVTAAGRGLLELLTELGVAPDAVVGHSSGEFAAVLASGAYTPRDEDELIRSIIAGIESTAGIAQSDLVSGAVLTAVGGAEPGAVEDVVARSEGRLVLAMDNCPHQQVIVGDEASTAEALEHLRGKGGLCQRIPWDRPYHTEAFAPLCANVEAYVRPLTITAPRVEFWSCATAAPFPDDPDAIKELIVRQWRSRVQFRETVLAMHAAGVRVFIEVGPRGNLSAFIADTLKEEPHAAIPMDAQHKHGLGQLCRAVGMMAAHGMEPRLDRLFRARRPAPVDLTGPPPPAPKPDPMLRLELPLLELSEDALAEARSRFAPPPPAATPPQPAQAEHPASATQPNPRDAAMADYQRTMQVFLRTQQAVMGASATRAASATAETPNPVAAAPKPVAVPRTGGAKDRVAPETITRPADDGGRYPYLHALLAHEPGRSLVAECELDPRIDVFLLDHTLLGREISINDPRLHTLPVMPLAMSLELMAEAAAKLQPDRVVTAVSDIRVSGWLAFEETSRRVRMTATLEQPGLVRVVLTEADREGMVNPIAEAIVELSSGEEELGDPVLPDVSREPPPWTPDEVYGKILYHGPAFQGVEVVERWSPEGIRARVRRPDPALLHKDRRRPALELPVQLIDTASQIPAMIYTNWKLEGSVCTCAFPHVIRRLEFAPSIPAREPLTAVARFTRDGGDLRSDVELVAADGRAILRYLGRVEKGVDFPLALYRYAFQPLTHRCARDITGLFNRVPGIDRVSLQWIQGPEYGLFAHSLWLKVLAHMVLDRREREALRSLNRPNGAQLEWLLGRIAAKEAIRDHLGALRCLADIRLETDAADRPVVILPSEPALRISVAHRTGRAAAAAVYAGSSAGVGVALEALQPMDDEAAAAAFSEEERSRLAGLIEAAPGWTADASRLAGIVARDAVGKALGAGFLDGPRQVEIAAVNPAALQLGVVLRGELAARHPELGAPQRPIPVHCRLLDGSILALCLLP